MKTQQQHQHPQPDLQFIANAQRAILVLERRKKAVIKKHSERTKRLRIAINAFVASAIDPNDMVISPGTLTPELIALIENPEQGL